MDLSAIWKVSIFFLVHIHQDDHLSCDFGGVRVMVVGGMGWGGGVLVDTNPLLLSYLSQSTI